MIPGTLLEAGPAKLLRAGVLAAPIACIAGIFLMTAGTDESWIVSGVRGLAEHGRYGAESPYRSAHSTGGAYTVVAAGLHVVGGGRLEVVRLVSVLGFAGLLLLLWRLGDRVQGNRTAAPWIMGAAIIALPGTFMLGSQAYGEILATALVVAGALAWGSKAGGTWGRRAWVGVILGTAAATRLHCILALAALPVGALMNPGRRRAELIDAIAAGIVGVAVFALQYHALWWISADPGSAGENMKASGFKLQEGGLAYLIPLKLDYWTISQGFLPLLAMVAVVAGWIWARPRVAAPQGPDALLAFSILMWGAWLVQAPIPHLRYAWPGLVGLAIVGGLVLAILADRWAQAGGILARTGVTWAAVSMLVAGYMDAARTYQLGESDILSWQLQRAMPLQIEFGPLRALRSQKSFVQRLNRIPPDEIVATVGFDTALSLLTRRTIVPASAYLPGPPLSDLQPLRHAPGTMPRWLAITPFVNRFPLGRIPPELHRWIEQNCRFDCKFGPYVLYEVTGKFPESSTAMDLHLWAPRLPLVPDPGRP